MTFQRGEIREYIATTEMKYDCEKKRKIVNPPIANGESATRDTQIRYGASGVGTGGSGGSMNRGPRAHGAPE